jgi:hypothetical protein
LSKETTGPEGDAEEAGVGRVVNQRDGTHELDAPTEDGGAEVLVLVELGALEDGHRVDDGDAAVQLAMRGVVV